MGLRNRQDGRRGERLTDHVSDGACQKTDLSTSGRHKYFCHRSIGRRAYPEDRELEKREEEVRKRILWRFVSQKDVSFPEREIGAGW